VSLGDRIRAAREAAGLSRDELASRAGVSSRTLGNWERGTVAPRSKLGALERVLAVRLREEPAEQDGVSLAGASDAELLANLAQRLAERDRTIRELQEEIQQLKPHNSSTIQSPRWAARTRDPDTGRAAQ
jgi:transcriptional regulator with XRE-family HTH domain